MINKVLFIFVILIVLFLIFSILISILLTNKLMYPKVRDEKAVYDREVELKRFPVEFYKTLDKEEVMIESQYGYCLSCLVLNNELTKQPQNANKVAIFCHGYKCSKTAAVVYAKMLMDLGFTAVLYDHRNHGLSDKKFTSMGFYEKDDLKEVVEWCLKRYGNKIRIVLHGESMGATTVLNYLACDDRIAAVIEDCGYSSLPELIEHQMKKYFHLSYPLFRPMINAVMKLRAGFTLPEVSAMQGVVKSEIPILFIHGDCDDYVPYQMSVKMYEKKKGPKVLYLAKGAIHARSCVVDLQKYSNVVTQFIQQYYE
ncbi:MAG: alpha/beta hydrolase [Clostridiales bacterium]|nr:alpha/beta hydrolase [Clostridiales bacterium]